MSLSEPQELTELLNAWGAGRAEALDVLATRVSGELRRMARGYLKREQADPLLESGALVNEAWLRLIDWQNTSWENRAHFFGLAAQMMRHILTDEARRRGFVKRGAGTFRVSLSEANQCVIWRAEELCALNTALERLESFDKRKAKMIELRYFAGFEQAEIAKLFELSTRTVQRELQFAQAWLYRELKKSPPTE